MKYRWKLGIAHTAWEEFISKNSYLSRAESLLKAVAAYWARLFKINTIVVSQNLE